MNSESKKKKSNSILGAAVDFYVFEKTKMQITNLYFLTLHRLNTTIKQNN
jgi:hypothetical protein